MRFLLLVVCGLATSSVDIQTRRARTHANIKDFQSSLKAEMAEFGVTHEFAEQPNSLVTKITAAARLVAKGDWAEALPLLRQAGKRELRGWELKNAVYAAAMVGGRPSEAGNHTLLRREAIRAAAALSNRSRVFGESIASDFSPAFTIRWVPQLKRFVNSSSWSTRSYAEALPFTVLDRPALTVGWLCRPPMACSVRTRAWLPRNPAPQRSPREPHSTSEAQSEHSSRKIQNSGSQAPFTSLRLRLPPSTLIDLQLPPFTPRFQAECGRVRGRDPLRHARGLSDTELPESTRGGGVGWPTGDHGEGGRGVSGIVVHAP